MSAFTSSSAKDSPPTLTVNTWKPKAWFQLRMPFFTAPMTSYCGYFACASLILSEMTQWMGFMPGLMFHLAGTCVASPVLGTRRRSLRKKCSLGGSSRGVKPAPSL